MPLPAASCIAIMALNLRAMRMHRWGEHVASAVQAVRNNPRCKSTTGSTDLLLVGNRTLCMGDQELLSLVCARLTAGSPIHGQGHPGCDILDGHREQVCHREHCTGTREWVPGGTFYHWNCHGARVQSSSNVSAMPSNSNASAVPTLQCPEPLCEVGLRRFYAASFSAPIMSLPLLPTGIWGVSRDLHCILPRKQVSPRSGWPATTHRQQVPRIAPSPVGCTQATCKPTMLDGRGHRRTHPHSHSSWWHVVLGVMVLGIMALGVAMRCEDTEC